MPLVADRERRITSPGTPSSKNLELWYTVKAWIEVEHGRDVHFHLGDDGTAVVEVMFKGKTMLDAVKAREDPWTAALRVISAIAGG